MKNYPEANLTQKGIYVLDEFPISILPGDFIKQLGLYKANLNHLSVKWLKSKDQIIDINLQFAKYTYPDNKQVYIYRFPEAIDRAVRIEDLESSIETIGFLVLVDVESFQQFEHEVARQHSALLRVSTYKLPIILAVVNASIIQRSTEKLSQAVDCTVDMPIVWCDGDINLDFVQQVMDVVYSYI